MMFRTRLLLAFLVATAIPLSMLAIGVRRQLTARTVPQYRTSVNAQAAIAREDLTRQSEAIGAALAALGPALAGDDRFRLAVRGATGERPYLLDYASGAMRAAGLSLLQIQDGEGRILSSGHFRQEYDRLEPQLAALVRQGAPAALVRARAAEGGFLALARGDSVVVAGRRLDLIGGIRIDSGVLRRFARDSASTLTLVLPDSSPAALPNESAVAAELVIPYIGESRAGVDTARLVIGHSLAGLRELQRDINRWFVASVGVIILVAGALALWLSARLSAPLAELARATERIELEGTAAPVAATAAARGDEIGALARMLARMTRRLRTSAVQLRDAERRATVGEMARQVNHDIRNGLIPIRNVLRHLAEVEAHNPRELNAIFAERRGTMESSVAYLETLAHQYAKLAPVLARRLVDTNAVVRETVAAAAVDGAVEARLEDGVPPIHGDRVMLRRIIENLVRNGVESLEGKSGRVTVRTARNGEGGVRITVSDTGRGMTENERSRAFDDFFTTKASGTGLGLSVVRRLTADLGGTVGVESEAGRGTTFSLDFPAASAVPRA